MPIEDLLRSLALMNKNLNVLVFYDICREDKALFLENAKRTRGVDVKKDDQFAH